MDHSDPTKNDETSQTSIPFVTQGSYPRRPGNRVRPLVDSGPAFRRICQAVENTQHSVWLTVTFVARHFQMPDGRGTLFDVLDAAAQRGVDVRVIFWRPNPVSSRYGQTFDGTQADFDWLAARGSRLSARWDRAPTAYCHHQKCWLIDAGESSETAFVGGINPTFAVVEPGHTGGEQRHDVYVEITGPCASDVHHNFVQRWNETSERNSALGVYGPNGQSALAFPTRLSKVQGPSTVQIQRNVHAGCYHDAQAAPGTDEAYPIADGERSITDQYLLAIDAARRSIYLENQALPVPAIAGALEKALKRGIFVVLLVPGEPEPHVALWRQSPERKTFFEQIEALGRYGNFTLAALARPTQAGGRRYVYVHAKLMLVDDAWATIGSCNLHANSLYGHSEMNASVWDAEAAKALRCQLFLEHLGQDTSDLDDRSAVRLYQNIAHRNDNRWRGGNDDWSGSIACSLKPQAYGKTHEPDDGLAPPSGKTV